MQGYDGRNRLADLPTARQMREAKMGGGGMTRNAICLGDPTKKNPACSVGLKMNRTAA